MQKLRDNINRHERELSENIGERSYIYPQALQKTADYITACLQGWGYTVLVQKYKAEKQTYSNLIAEKSGTGKSPEIIVIGAHYDTVIGTPGADDNASGIAGLLELARLSANYDFNHTIRFAAFTLEEPPYFKTEYMGSRIYARHLREKNEKIKAMLCLESIGFYTDRKNSQSYPVPLMNLFYPDQGNFIAVVGNWSSRRLVSNVAAAINAGCKVQVETLVAPALIPGVDFSDHASFWLENYPAVMITDTAMFRNPHYHQATDTPMTLNLESLTDLVQGLWETVKKLDGG